MRIFVLTATYELRVSRKNHLRDHPTVHTQVGKKTLTLLIETNFVVKHSSEKGKQVLTKEKIVLINL
jgi:hypothetical protein